MSNFEILQIQLYHRNTLGFMGMAERKYYLAFRKYQDKFYALDKSNFINCWSLTTGKLLAREKLIDKDYFGYETDRQVYDKGWFKYTVIFKPTLVNEEGKEEEGQVANKNFGYYIFKIIEITEQGGIVEKLSFIHQYNLNTYEMHLYFNEDFT